MFRLDLLDALSDSELGTAIQYADGLLKKRDEQRKAQAMADARALEAEWMKKAEGILAAAGLKLKDLNGKVRARGLRKRSYKNGHHYQHPTRKDLLWNGAGKKPNWLRQLEKEGKEAMEVANG